MLLYIQDYRKMSEAEYKFEQALDQIRDASLELLALAEENPEEWSKIADVNDGYILNAIDTLYLMGVTAVEDYAEVEVVAPYFKKQSKAQNGANTMSEIPVRSTRIPGGMTTTMGTFSDDEIAHAKRLQKEQPEAYGHMRVDMVAAFVRHSEQDNS